MLNEVINNGSSIVKNKKYNDPLHPVPTLYMRKEDCCGCEACVAICQMNAIEMFEDEEGFYYPSIDAKECIRCNSCINACPIKSVR